MSRKPAKIVSMLQYRGSCAEIKAESLHFFSSLCKKKESRK